MEIIQDAKESLAQRQVDQWQDGYPDEEIIFEDILESRGYVAVEDQGSRRLCSRPQGK